MVNREQIDQDMDSGTVCVVEVLCQGLNQEAELVVVVALADDVHIVLRLQPTITLVLDIGLEELFGHSLRGHRRVQGLHHCSVEGHQELQRIAFAR